MNDGKVRPLDATAMILAGFIVYKVTFGGLHILWFKLRVMCKRGFKVHDVNLKREVKRLKKAGNDRDSEMGSLLSMEEEFLKDEEQEGADDDQILDVSMRPDRKMDDALKKKLDASRAANKAK